MENLDRVVHQLPHVMNQSSLCMFRSLNRLSPKLLTWPAFFMNASAAIEDSKVKIQCGILSSRRNHARDARPRKRSGDALGCGRTASKRAGSALEPASPLLQGGQPPRRSAAKVASPLRNSQAGCCRVSRLRAPVSRGDCAISRRTVMNTARSDHRAPASNPTIRWSFESGTVNERLFPWSHG
jgi:hypothetical protein